ncbi:MAG: aminotransferase [Betaproteobacteria bacterium HGW-Betaproteobacteria-22]|nr:MAG: aminotransferase [Betaproteobacteria bacterium HGW-Betaproteobacteria-22]
MKSMKNLEWAPWPHYEDDEIEKVTSLLKSGKVNYWTGDEGRQFETEYAQYLGRKHAVAVANGTVALELALYALGIGAGDEVIVPSRTYIASASCAVMRGALPVVADVDSISQVLTVQTIAAALTNKTKAIVVVHLAGWPCEMDEIMVFANERGLFVIEDCAQAHGACYKGKPVGAWGHVAAFSFCQDKIMSTGGEGGLIALDDELLWKKAWAYKDIGRSYDAVYNKEHAPGFRWLTESFGTNWRLTEIQSAIGRIQLRKLDDWILKRRANAEILNKGFASIDGLIVHIPDECVYHSYYKHYAFVQIDKLAEGWSRNKIMEEINVLGIPCGVGSCSEIYLEKAFIDSGYAPVSRLENAKKLGEISLMFQVHPTLSSDHMNQTVKIVKQVMNSATNNKVNV